MLLCFSSVQKGYHGNVLYKGYHGNVLYKAVPYCIHNSMCLYSVYMYMYVWICMEYCLQAIPINQIPITTVCTCTYMYCMSRFTIYMYNVDYRCTSSDTRRKISCTCTYGASPSIFHLAGERHKQCYGRDKHIAPPCLHRQASTTQYCGVLWGSSLDY